MQADSTAQKEMLRMGARGVPTFVIGEEVITGLDTARIEAALDYRVQKCLHCGQKTRLPKGKGKIRITCPGCGYKYETKT